jgi:cytoskeletal protein CcmA (bactofilin family)
MTPGRAVRFLAAALAVSGPLVAGAQEFQQLLVKKGTLKGDQYLAGGTVDVHGSVEGDLTMAGLQAGLDGTVTDDVNAVGLLVHVGGVVGDDVRALGGRVIVQGWVGDALLAAGGEIALTPSSREMSGGTSSPPVPTSRSTATSRGTPGSAPTRW